MIRPTDATVLAAIVAHINLHDLENTIVAILPGFTPARIRLDDTPCDDRPGIAALARWAASLDAATATRHPGPGGQPRLTIDGTLQTTCRDIAVRVTVDVSPTTEPTAIIPVTQLAEQVAA